jgi:hypothetical protein
MPDFVPKEILREIRAPSVVLPPPGPARRGAVAGGRPHDVRPAHARIVRELDRQIHRVEMTFRHTYGYQRAGALSPDAVLRHLATNIDALHRQIRNIEQDLAAFDDIKHLRRMLKSSALVRAESA